MSAWKKYCSLVALTALLLAPGCYFNRGFRTVKAGTTEERLPLSRQGPIQSTVQHAPAGQVVLQLTQQQQEEVRTVLLMQRVKLQFDLTGLALAGFAAGVGLFILFIVVVFNMDGSSSSGGGWDWD